MVSDLAKNWWTLAVRGALAVAFGLAAIIWPEITIVVLLTLFGAYLIVDGIVALGSALGAAKRETRWWPMVLEGLVDISIGILVFAVPGVTTVVLLFFVAFWAILTGIFRISAAVELRREIRGEWLMIVSGAVSVILGLLLLAFPAAGALALVTVIGIFAVIIGILTIALSLRLRGWHETEAKDEHRRMAA